MIQNASQSQQEEMECRVCDENPRIPEDILYEKMKNMIAYFSFPSSIKDKIYILLDGLYNVPKAVRSFIQKEYNLDKIANHSRNKYDELQVKYALNEITRKTWEQGVYKNYVKQLVSELISNILYIYLGNMDGFQSQLYNYNYLELSGSDAQYFIQTLMENMDQLINTTNFAISEIYKDYQPTCTNQMVIRKLGESQKSFCAKQSIKTNASSASSYDELSTTSLNEKHSMKPIVLYDYQIPHVEKLESFLQNTHFAMDLSPLGTGKTYSASKIYQNNPHYKHLLVISPSSVKTKWAEVDKKYGLQITRNLTYCQIAGKRGLHPSHGLLIRNDYKVEVVGETGVVHMMDKYVFTPTDYLKDLVKNGMLIVFDEFQHLKNDCAQTEACETIVRVIMDDFLLRQENPEITTGNSRLLLMSGSPMDKPEQATRLFRTLGIMRNPRIVSGYQHAGINEVIE